MSNTDTKNAKNGTDTGTDTSPVDVAPGSGAAANGIKVTSLRAPGEKTLESYLNALRHDHSAASDVDATEASFRLADAHGRGLSSERCVIARPAGPGASVNFVSVAEKIEAKGVTVRTLKGSALKPLGTFANALRAAHAGTPKGAVLTARYTIRDAEGKGYRTETCRIARA